MIRVADYIANYIYDELKVKHVFMVTGAGIMHLTDGVASHKKLETICPHHEQTSSMAVDAYSRATENMGVGFFTSGPGGTNAITGLGGAWQDSVPCLFISGQVKKIETTNDAKISGLRQFGVQELDLVPIVQSLCKYATTLNDPKKVRYEFEKACHIAKSGRPGPVWIQIPMDVQSTKIDETNLQGFSSSDTIPVATDTEIHDIIKLLKNSSRPVIISGQGIRLSDSIPLLEEFTSKYKIPVVTPFLGIDTMNHDLFQYVGKTGVKGERAANFAMQNSDLIIAIGTSLHVTVVGYTYEHFAREAKKIIVDIDETSHKKKTIKVDQFIHSDAKKFLEKILKFSNDADVNEYLEWAQQCNTWKNKYPTCLPEYENTKGAISSYLLIDKLSNHSKENDIFVSDAGGTYYATSQAIQLTKKGQRYIPSGAMATMGYSLPAAIGISVATNKKRVIALTGDGSFQQNIQELQTLIEYDLPVKLFVLNNNGYESIRTSQKNYFENRFLGESNISGLSFPDTRKIANAYGIKFIKISKTEEMDTKIEEILTFDGPVICEVIVPEDQKIIPTVSSRVNADGTMSSRPLEDMYPFLDRNEYKNNLYIEEV
ncbi:MAG: thiamine pyrophosphate-binding protein [Thaumarchaeota archaeon]|nr:thiamine pyrophosphate-binding protein [Nitrososphaerota archaeon]